jgi:carboxyl-terminal processing protease
MRPAIVVTLAAITNAAVAQGPTSPLRPRSTAEDLQLFSQVLNQIRINHPDSVDLHDLFMAAIEGMVHAADPHSYVVVASRLAPALDSAWRAGRLYPVPIDFSFWGGSPVVVSVAPGSKAVKLDILPGDVLVSVDSASVTAASSEELDIALAGRKGTTVTLIFERRRLDGSLVRLTRTVKRERTEETTAVPAAFMLDGETGYIRVTTFANPKAGDDLHAALGRLEGRGMKRLVLDLRDNGGGDIEAAASVAGEFLPKGAIVYTAEYRKKPEGARDTVRVGRSFWSHEKRYPLVVLSSAGTASASELVEGALQDHDRALIVGRPSFGKALLMRGLPLSDGSSMWLVVGRLRTPCGRIIQREYRGVTRRDYFRLARAERDTAGRPSCHSASGRTLYGGGGIYPDIALPEASPAPLWLARVREADLPLKWVGGYVTAAGPALSDLDDLATRRALPPDALAGFRTLAAAEGVEIPADADSLLQGELVRAVALAKWGEEGYYRLVAVTDPQVAIAAQQFARAAAILSASKGPN